MQCDPLKTMLLLMLLFLCTFTLMRCCLFEIEIYFKHKINSLENKFA